jgi:hypothetical protein
MGAKQTNKSYDTFKDVLKSFGSNLTPLRFLTTSSAKRLESSFSHFTSPDPEHLCKNIVINCFLIDCIIINDKIPFSELLHSINTTSGTRFTQSVRSWSSQRCYRRTLARAVYSPVSRCKPKKFAVKAKNSLQCFKMTTLIL